MELVSVFSTLGSPRFKLAACNSGLETWCWEYPPLRYPRLPTLRGICLVEISQSSTADACDSCIDSELAWVVTWRGIARSQLGQTTTTTSSSSTAESIRCCCLQALIKFRNKAWSNSQARRRLGRHGLSLTGRGLRTIFGCKIPSSGNSRVVMSR
jgi:hypothetical protein